MPLFWHVVPGLAYLQHREYKQCVNGWTTSRRQVADDVFFYLTSFMLLVIPFILFLPRVSRQGNKHHNKRVASPFPNNDSHPFPGLAYIFQFLEAKWFGSNLYEHSFSTESLFRCNDAELRMDTFCLDTSYKPLNFSALSLKKVDGMESPEFDVQGSPEVNVQGSPEVNVQGSPEVNVQGSPEVNVQGSPEVNVQGSPEVDVQGSPEVNVQGSPKFDV
ncbi:hypothetical protein Pmani_016292 [Petrolisthes manimaculis]|uniref:Uncharacterized protein n=1 Tax=Petrolisthes manimaculis TaxID=1843537 RepID=A0AAE1PSK6_9EUCA|nr:hypothetical protein Pmani_016292 [Petrolisthes manimaculis]